MWDKFPHHREGSRHWLGERLSGAVSDILAIEIPTIPCRAGQQRLSPHLGIIFEFFQIRRFVLRARIRTASQCFCSGRFARLRKRCFRQIPLSPVYGELIWLA
jgi:hypothetical protein